MGLFLLTGCSGGNKPPVTGTSPMMGGGNVTGALPGVAAATTLLDVSVLATLPRPNPFASLLISDIPPLQPTEPQPVEAESEIPPEYEAVEPTPPPPNPLDMISLGGILYREKNPLAILVLPTGKTQIVHPGDTVMVMSGGSGPSMVKVNRITRTSVILKLLNPPTGLTAPPVKTVQIASIIGFRGKSSGQGDASSDAASGSSPLDSASPTLPTLPGNTPSTPGAPSSGPGGPSPASGASLQAIPSQSASGVPTSAGAPSQNTSTNKP
jgi:hypothetical protein